MGMVLFARTVGAGVGMKPPRVVNSRNPSRLDEMMLTVRIDEISVVSRDSRLGLDPQSAS
jgi:hypothetical protein